MSFEKGLAEIEPFGTKHTQNIARGPCSFSLYVGSWYLFITSIKGLQIAMGITDFHYPERHASSPLLLQCSILEQIWNALSAT